MHKYRGQRRYVTAAVMALVQIESHVQLRLNRYPLGNVAKYLTDPNCVINHL